MPKFCNYCGAPLKEGVRFCTRCGQPVAQSTQQQPSYAQQPPQQAYAYGGYPPYQQPQKKKGGCCMVALIVLLVMLVVLGVGGYFFYKFAKDKFEEVKDRIEETTGVPLSSIISPENMEELEKLGVTPEDIDKTMEKAEENDKPNKTKKEKGGKKIAVKDEVFFGVTLPFPDMGEITSNFSDRSGSIETKVYYIDKISYQQYIEYCKLLEALPGWEAHKEDNVAHFPKDYNKKMSTLCVGDYNGLHVVVTYLSDSFIQGTDMSHFSLKVTNKG